jgi:adenylosuccinate synthase
MPPKHVVVAGMAYGDEGKGTMVDYLCRSRDAKLVVRYNGGPQAGHHVVTPEGHHHCASQWGAGTLAGVPTYLSRFMMIEPYAMYKEAETLAGMIHNPLEYLMVDEDCPVITPYHWLLNRLRECARGDERHSSCGMGVGELRQDELDGEFVIRAKHLPFITWATLEEIKQRKFADARKIAYDPGGNKEAARWFKRIADEEPRNVAAFYNDFASRIWIVPEKLLRGRLDKEPAIFEGAQGVLLDQSLDPKYSTWSDCTFNQALELLGDRPVEKLGVWRTYFTRHGRGPLAGEKVPWKPYAAEQSAVEHNVDNPWQGPLRFAPFDIEEATDAKILVGGLDGIALTHCDALPPRWPYRRYGMISYADSNSIEKTIEYLLGPPVRYKSYGPTWKDKVACMGTPEFDGKTQETANR